MKFDHEKLLCSKKTFFQEYRNFISISVIQFQFISENTTTKIATTAYKIMFHPWGASVSMLRLEYGILQKKRYDISHSSFIILQWAGARYPTGKMETWKNILFWQWPAWQWALLHKFCRLPAYFNTGRSHRGSLWKQLSSSCTCWLSYPISTAGRVSGSLSRRLSVRLSIRLSVEGSGVRVKAMQGIRTRFSECIDLPGRCVLLHFWGVNG